MDALVDAATTAASSANVRRRAGDALGAAATAADFESAAFVARRAAPALLRRAESESSFESSLSSLALAALARLASSSAAARARARRLCDAAANDGVLMTRFDHAALVDALAGVAIDAGTETTDRSGSSRSSPTSDFSPPGILPSAAAASRGRSRASEEEDAAMRSSGARDARSRVGRDGGGGFRAGGTRVSPRARGDGGVFRREARSRTPRGVRRRRRGEGRDRDGDRDRDDVPVARVSRRRRRRVRREKRRGRVRRERRLDVRHRRLGRRGSDASRAD